MFRDTYLMLHGTLKRSLVPVKLIRDKLYSKMHLQRKTQEMVWFELFSDVIIPTEYQLLSKNKKKKKADYIVCYWQHSSTVQQRGRNITQLFPFTRDTWKMREGSKMFPMKVTYLSNFFFTPDLPLESQLDQEEKQYAGDAKDTFGSLSSIASILRYRIASE